MVRYNLITDFLYSGFMSTFQIRQQNACEWLASLGQQSVALAAFCLADNQQPLAKLQCHNLGSQHNAWLQLCPRDSFSAVLVELYRVMQSDRDAFVLTNALQLGPLQLMAQAAQFRLGPLRVVQLTNRRGNSHQRYLVHIRKGRPLASWKQPKQLYQLPLERDSEMPTALFETLVEEFSDTEELVIDPFMLDGSIATTALSKQRRFAGSQADPDKFNLLKQQLNQLPNVTELMRQLPEAELLSKQGQIQLL